MIMRFTILTGSLVICISLLFMTTGRASAATYYVAQGNAKASDSGPGTAKQPWKTINHAAQALQPGDTVMVRVGVYIETADQS